MRKFAVAVALAAVVSGCQTAKVALNDNVTRLEGKSVVAVKRPDAPFYQKTMGSSMAIVGIGGIIGASVGAALEASGGSEMKEAASLVDPANGLADALTAALVAKYGMQRVDPRPPTRTTRLDILMKEHKGADFMVDVRTVNWSVAPTSFQQYSLVYVAEFKLLEAGSKKPVAQALCQSGHGNTAKPPTREELLANEGALLREYTASAANRCLAEWSEQLLRVAPPPMPATALPPAPAGSGGQQASINPPA